VFVDAIARGDPRIARVWFDASGVAGLGSWMEKRDQVAARLRQLGIRRILCGSDGAAGENTPQRALAAFRQLPLSAAVVQTIESHVAPYMR
jgi:hypothetical protein